MQYGVIRGEVMSEANKYKSNTNTSALKLHTDATWVRGLQPVSLQLNHLENLNPKYKRLNVL